MESVSRIVHLGAFVKKPLQWGAFVKSYHLGVFVKLYQWGAFVKSNNKNKMQEGTVIPRKNRLKYIASNQ